MSFDWKGLPVVIFGIGGFSKEVKILIDDINKYSNIPIFDLKGFVSHIEGTIGNIIEGLPIVTCNENFVEYASKFDKLGVVIALGSPHHKEQIERDIFSKCVNLVYPNLIHPSANITSSESNDFGVGSIICAGVTVTTNIKFGKFIIVNINTTVGHDVTVGDYCTINPLCAISGNVSIRKGSLIGAGASIREKLSIGENCTVGLGAIVVKDVIDNDIIICKRATKLEK
ncbi:acetyltransferase [Clostridium estertheticum]|uniref:PglD-related sugar-binding protein n=1 Tax=Clostridium estertheticum TaxID=238834 RepID=UPI001C7CA04E|nr:acetyltransferase [Clostridium estertheticum]MBX4258431.1 acetyltransferase [Clostridium estertheticum]WLC69614.1 acetyltransferase [Clostridium estertheticum]